MAEKSQAPTSVARKQVGTLLRTARSALQLDLSEVVEELGVGWSISKLGRIERGEGGKITLGDVTILAKVLQLDDDTRENLTELIKLAATRSWWYSFRDVVRGGFRIYADLESSAKRMSMYHDNIVPGLLQTTEYAAVLDRTFFASETEMERSRRLQFKFERQAFVTRKTKPLALEVILHEAVLHTQVGGARIQNEQLLQLIEMSKRPNISIRILPFSAGLPLGVATGSFTIIEASEQAVVYFESLDGAACRDDEECVKAHTSAMVTIRQASLDDFSSRALLRQISKKG